MGSISAASAAERRTKHHEADVVVVGAGIFGCAIAHALASQGRSVLLLERSLKEPDRIVGELLQPGGVAALRKLGLGTCLEGIDAVPCYGYNVLFHHEDVLLRYPLVDDLGRVGPAALEKDGAKRPEGRSFHHGRFIMQLRRACAANPNITIVETEVTGTIRGEHSDRVLGVDALTVNPDTGAKEPDYFFGELTFIADGYNSRFRKQYIPRSPVVRSKFYALELLDCPLPHTGFGHVIIGKAYPVLLYQIGSRETRALIDVPNGTPLAAPAAGGVRGYIRDVVIPSLPADVRPSFAAALADGRIPRSMPNSWLPPSRQPAADGVLVAGDAMNMRHPLTGGGMTVAFNDVLLLSALLRPEAVPSLADVGAVRAALASWHWRRKALTGNVNVLAQALYALFAASDRQLAALQRGCFAYFQWGRGDDPMVLLGGVVQRPLLLAYHFFTVAFVALWLNAVEVVGGGWGLWRAPLALVDAVLILWKAAVVFLPVLYQELR